MRGGHNPNFVYPASHLEIVVLKLNTEIKLVPTRSFELNQEII